RLKVPALLADCHGSQKGVPRQAARGFARALHVVANAQLFFDVCATRPLKCGTTFEFWHLGHFTSAFPRSEKVMINSNGLLHFSHMGPDICQPATGTIS